MGKYLLALAALVLSVHAHAERKIYSCKDASGNAVFSSEPCGKDAKEVPYDAGSVARPVPAESETPPTEDSATDSVKKVPKKAHRDPKRTEPSDAIQDIADGVADSDCRRRAQQSAIYPNDFQIQELERRKRNIEQQGTYARNNLAGAQYLTGIREQLGQMDIAIAQERTRISQESGRVNAQQEAS